MRGRDLRVVLGLSWLLKPMDEDFDKETWPKEGVCQSGYVTAMASMSNLTPYICSRQQGAPKSKTFTV